MKIENKQEYPDISSVPQDIVPPKTVTGDASPGLRILGSLPEYEGTEVHHTLYDLPYRNHTDTWVLRNIPLRTRLRTWFEELSKLSNTAF